MTDNELIAEFMELPRNEEFGKVYWDYKKTGIPIYYLPTRYLGYHRSWDWLMPVVEKIWSLGYSFILHFPSGDYFFTGVVSYNNNYHKKQENDVNNIRPINCAYQAVIEFIKWYNENKK